MMTSSDGNIFRVTGPLCGEFTGPGEFPTQRPVTRSFDVFFDLRLNIRVSKQSWGWCFETPSWSLWRQCNAFEVPVVCQRPLWDYYTAPMASKCMHNVWWGLTFATLLGLHDVITQTHFPCSYRRKSITQRATNRYIFLILDWSWK